MATEIPKSLLRIATQRGSTLDFQLPPFPPLPDTVLRRFPELRDWSLRVDDWRRTLAGLIRETTSPLRDDPEADPGQLPEP